MQQENLNAIENKNNNSQFSNDDYSSQELQKIEQPVRKQEEKENSIFLLEHQDDNNIRQQSNQNFRKQSEDEIDIIQFPDNREMFFNNNQEEFDRGYQEQNREQTNLQNIPIHQGDYNTHLNDRNIPLIQQRDQQIQAQQAQMQYCYIPVPFEQQIPIDMIPTQQQNCAIQPTNQYINQSNQDREEENQKLKKKNQLNQQINENSDKQYQNTVVVVPISQNESASNAIVNLGSNLSAYCCLGMLNRSDSCCQWMCDLIVYCLTFPIILIKKLIVFCWGGCLKILCQSWCPNWHDSCQTCCSLLGFNCFRCYNSLKKNSNIICTQICFCINCSAFSKEILACFDSCTQFIFQICSAFGGCILVCFEFIFHNLGDCLVQICTFCCDCLGNSCEVICTFSGAACNSLCKVLCVCIGCLECFR